MVTRQQFSTIAKIAGHALLDIAAELEDEADEPDLLSPVAQPLNVSLLHRVGLGGNGVDRSIPECPVCYARGGGGHGGGCPNSGNDKRFWVMTAPAGWMSPDYPQSREKW